MQKDTVAVVVVVVVDPECVMEEEEEERKDHSAQQTPKQSPLRGQTTGCSICSKRQINETLVVWKHVRIE